LSAIIVNTAVNIETCGCSLLGAQGSHDRMPNWSTPCHSHHSM